MNGKNGDTSDTSRFLVIAVGLLFAGISILRLIWRIYIGTDDSTLIDFQITMSVIFTGLVTGHFVNKR